MTRPKKLRRALAKLLFATMIQALEWRLYGKK